MPTNDKMSLPIPQQGKEKHDRPLTTHSLLQSQLGPPKSLDNIRKSHQAGCQQCTEAYPGSDLLPPIVQQVGVHQAGRQQSIGAYLGPTLLPPIVQQAGVQMSNSSSIATSSSAALLESNHENTQSPPPRKKVVINRWKIEDNLKLMQMVEEHSPWTGDKSFMWAKIAAEFNNDDRQYRSSGALEEHYRKLRHLDASVASLQQAVFHKQAGVAPIPINSGPPQWTLEDELGLVKLADVFSADIDGISWDKLADKYNVDQREYRTPYALRRRYYMIRERGGSVILLEQELDRRAAAGIQSPSGSFIQDRAR